MNATTTGSISALSATKKAHKLTTRHVELVVRAARAAMGRVMAKEVVAMAKEPVEDAAIKEVALTAIAAAAEAALRSLTATVAIVASMVTRQRTAGLLPLHQGRGVDNRLLYGYDIHSANHSIRDGNSAQRLYQC